MHNSGTKCSKYPTTLLKNTLHVFYMTDCFFPLKVSVNRLPVFQASFLTSTNAVQKPWLVINGKLPLFQTAALNKPVHDQLRLLSFHNVIPPHPLAILILINSDTETVKMV